MWVGLQHRDGFAEAWEDAGRFASRRFSSFFARFSFWRHYPTVLVGGCCPRLWPDDVDRFPQFSAIAKKRLFICIQMMPKTAEIDQGWPSFRASLTRSRSCTIRNSRQSTLDPLNFCRKRKTADARPWVKYMLGRAIRLWFSGATVSLRPFRRHLRVWVGQS